MKEQDRIVLIKGIKLLDRKDVVKEIGLSNARYVRAVIAGKPIPIDWLTHIRRLAYVKAKYHETEVKFWRRVMSLCK